MKSKLLRALRVRKCYTPKQWENEFLSVVASKKEAAG